MARADRAGFEPVARHVVADSPTWAQPAISGDRIFVKDVDTLTLWTLTPPPSLTLRKRPGRRYRLRAPHPRIQPACWRRLMCSKAAIARNPERVVPANLAASSMRSSVRRAMEMFSRTVSRSASSSARLTLTAPII